MTSSVDDHDAVRARLLAGTPRWNLPARYWRSFHPSWTWKGRVVLTLILLTMVAGGVLAVVMLGALVVGGVSEVIDWRVRATTRPECLQASDAGGRR